MPHDHKGSKNPNFGKIAWNKGKKMPPLSEEHKRKLRKLALTSKRIEISINNLPKNWRPIGKLNWMYGKHHTEETKRKMSEKLKIIKKGCKNPYTAERNRLLKPIQMKGSKNPNWKGGKSFEPYGIIFNNKLREQIRKRDNYRCQECFRHQSELRTKTNRLYKLSIHHIDFNKQNNNKNNLISLCKSCHIQTNYNREKWTSYFQNKVNFNE